MSLRRHPLVASLLAILTISGMMGCNRQSSTTTPEAKQAFLGDASKMPASAKQDIAKMAQQNAQASQRANQQAQQQPARR